MKVLYHSLFSLVVCVVVTSGCFHPKDNNSAQLNHSPFCFRQMEDSVVLFVLSTHEYYPDIELNKLEVFLHEKGKTIITATLSPEFGIPSEKVKRFGGCQFLGKKMIVFSDSDTSSLFNYNVLKPQKACEFIGEEILLGLDREAQGITREWRLINDSTLVLDKIIEIRMTPSKIIR